MFVTYFWGFGLVYIVIRIYNEIVINIKLMTEDIKMIGLEKYKSNELYRIWFKYIYDKWYIYIYMYEYII